MDQSGLEQRFYNLSQTTSQQALKIKELEAQLQASLNESQECQQLNQSLQQNQQETQQQFNDLSNEYTKSQSELTRYAAFLKFNQTISETKDKSIQVLSDQVTELKSQLTKTQSQTTGQQLMSDESKEIFIAKINSFASNEQLLKEQIKNLKGIQMRLEQENQSMKEKITSFKDKVSSLEASLKISHKEIETHIQEKNIQVNNLRKQREELVLVRQQIQEENQKQIQELEKNLLDKSEDFDKINRENFVMHQEILNLKDQLKQVIEESEKRQKKVDKLQRDKNINYDYIKAEKDYIKVINQKFQEIQQESDYLRKYQEMEDIMLKEVQNQKIHYENIIIQKLQEQREHYEKIINECQLVNKSLNGNQQEVKYYEVDNQELRKQIQLLKFQINYQHDQVQYIDQQVKEKFNSADLPKIGNFFKIIKIQCQQIVKKKLEEEEFKQIYQNQEIKDVIIEIKGENDYLNKHFKQLIQLLRKITSKEKDLDSSQYKKILLVFEEQVQSIRELVINKSEHLENQIQTLQTTKDSHIEKLNQEIVVLNQQLVTLQERYREEISLSPYQSQDLYKDNNDLRQQLMDKRRQILSLTQNLKEKQREIRAQTESNKIKDFNISQLKEDLNQIKLEKDNLLDYFQKVNQVRVEFSKAVYDQNQQLIADDLIIKLNDIENLRLQDSITIEDLKKQIQIKDLDIHSLNQQLELKNQELQIQEKRVQAESENQQIQTEVYKDQEILDMIIAQQEYIDQLLDSTTQQIDQMMSAFYSFSRLRQQDFKGQVEKEYEQQVISLKQGIEKYKEQVREQNQEMIKIKQDKSDTNKQVVDQLRKEKLGFIQNQAQLQRKIKDYEQQIIQLRSDFAKQLKNQSNQISLLKTELEKQRSGTQIQEQEQPRIIKSMMNSLNRGKDILSDLNAHLQDKK